jgi:ubiquinone/menaquinone biosynthesis C-methylase UbiE
MVNPTQQIIADFNELADLVDPGESGQDYYDNFLVSLIPSTAQHVLDIGCGLGRLTYAIARKNRRVIGIDVSPRMIQRARATELEGVSFVEGDFLALNLGDHSFDCIISAAALHHMPYDIALPRMRKLLRPGGRLIIHDLRRDATVGDVVRSCSAFSGAMLKRLALTGRLRPSKAVRQAWDRHGKYEKYLSIKEARNLTIEHIPGASLKSHWLWRYTIVWEKPAG